VLRAAPAAGGADHRDVAPLLRPLPVRVLLVAVLLVLGLAVVPERGQALEAGLVTDLTWFPSERERERTAEVLRDSGSRWVRLSVGWHDFEPRPGVYDPWLLEHYGREIQRARDAGQKVLLMVHETPAWASGSADRNAPPRDPRTFAGFLRFLGERYGRSVEAYEIWNEPNLARFWAPGPDPAGYAALLRAAHPAVKAVDPTAKVVFAGPSTNDHAFVEAVYAAGVKGSFDVMGAHPYSCDAPAVIKRGARGRIDRGSFLGYRELRATMAARGDRKPIWFTEFGWATTSGACGVRPEQQAAWLRDALRLAAQDGIQVALYYNLRNNFDQDDADETEAQYGLMTTSFVPKPAYAAFRAFARGDRGVRTARVRARSRATTRRAIRAARTARSTRRGGDARRG
jgi:hypothetical protein